MIEISDVRGADGVVDVAALRRVYGRFPTGVMAVAALEDGEPIGIAASSFNTVSMDPPLVVVSIQKNSATWPKIAASERIGLSIVSEHQETLTRQLAARGLDDRFVGAEWEATGHGAVLVDGAAAWLECSVYSVTEAGDHDLVLLKVLRQGTNSQELPLIFHDSAFHGIALKEE